MGIFKNLKELFSNKNIRNRVFFTVFAIILYRFLANVPPAGIEVDAFSNVFAGNPLSNVFTLATGGSLDSPSLVMIGLGAYINASIIIQLLSTVIPKWEALSKEGQAGRQLLSQYTRFLAIPLSIVQGWVLYIMLSRSPGASEIIGSDLLSLEVITFIASISAGSLFLMWLGELISENGIGNGTSIIISFSVISSLPRLITTDLGRVGPVWNSFLEGSITFIELMKAPDFVFLYTVILGLIFMVFLIVFMNEGIRKITIQYARRVNGGVSYLPLRINQSGVMPVIFASAILTFPGIIAQLLTNAFEQGTTGDKVITWVNNSFLNNFNSLEYNIFYFLMIIGFTFFYTFVITKPSDTADNLKKGGGFIPGIRPGKSTEKYIIDVLVKLTTVGAIFLAIITIVPTIARIYFSNGGTTSTLGILSGIGGTSLLIIVSVLLTTYRQIISMRVTKSYDKYR